MNLSKYNIITTALLIISIILILSLATSPRFSCVRESECIVDCKTYDSLVAIANRPPEIDTIIHIDTVPGAPIIKWKDRLAPVYKDSLSTVYKDTLQTKDFRVITTDTLQWNELKYRKYDYISYPKILFITKEIDKPVFVPQPYPVPKSGLYYGGELNVFPTGGQVGGEVFYVTKKDRYIGVQGGTIGYKVDTYKYYPYIGIKFGSKF